jgi:hypothetical protein
MTRLTRLTKLPPPLLGVESAHAAAMSTMNQPAKLIVGPSNGVLDLPGRRDKRMELSDLPPRMTPSPQHSRCAEARLWPVAGGRWKIFGTSTN